MHKPGSDKTPKAELQDFEQLTFPYMTKDAIERYQRVKAVHPENAASAIVACAVSIKEKKLTKISDAYFKSVLQEVHNHLKRR